jgi:predicted house-cleaning noncanonical NTP pyrophosphatase (MazG superfamily)
MIGKLVRDKIFPSGDPSDDHELARYALAKVVEEAREVGAAGEQFQVDNRQLTEEIGDLEDAIDLVCQLFELDKGEILASRIHKGRDRGGFEKRLIWNGK